MAKQAKKKADKVVEKKRGKYDEPLTVKGSFLDIIKASTKDAENKSSKKP